MNRKDKLWCLGTIISPSRCGKVSWFLLPNAMRCLLLKFQSCKHLFGVAQGEDPSFYGGKKKTKCGIPPPLKKEQSCSKVIPPTDL